MKALIPTALRRFTHGNRLVELQADNVAAALALLTTQYPELRPHLLGDDGKIPNFVNVFVNDTNIRDLDREATLLAPDDELILVASISGG